MSHVARRVALAVVAAATVVVGVSTGVVPALAHGFSSTVYADVSSPEPGRVRVVLELEYDLLVASAAEAGDDVELFRTGDAAFDTGDTKGQVAALEAHAGTVTTYVSERFGVTAEGTPCTPARLGGFALERRDGVPYARVILDYRCPEHARAHEVRSGLFADSEGKVRGTETIVTYDLDSKSGSAALSNRRPAFSVRQSTAERFWEFFQLGAAHLLTGIDHILFLLALIAGSRRLREVVLAATTFTLAHSVTFVLAALGLVRVPASLVEPIIALSIAVVAAWYLWRIKTRGSHATDLATARHGNTRGRGHLSLDRAGWARLAVVFCFGLVHGLGFAGALGIDEPWSWRLLWSLLVFNIGIEAVQLAIIAAVFPTLALLRHRAPTLALWTTGAISAGVCLMGMLWFVQRALAL